MMKCLLLIMVCFGKREQWIETTRCLEASRVTACHFGHALIHREHSDYKRFKGMGIWHLCASGRACVIIYSFRAPRIKKQTPYLARAGTPPGEESRLTRALKAHHIDKARDPTDLPEWPFEKHESRRAAAASTPSVSGRGLRDVYDVAAITSRQQPETRETSMSRGRQLHRQDDSDVPMSGSVSAILDVLHFTSSCPRSPLDCIICHSTNIKSNFFTKTTHKFYWNY
jgi:hypothetical protein